MDTRDAPRTLLPEHSGSQGVTTLHNIARRNDLKARVNVDAPHSHLGPRGSSSSQQTPTYAAKLGRLPEDTLSRSGSCPKTRSEIGFCPRPYYHFGSVSRGPCLDVMKSPARLSTKIIWLHQLASSVGNVEEYNMPPKRNRAQGTGETSRIESMSQGSENPNLTVAQIAELVATTVAQILANRPESHTPPDQQSEEIKKLREEVERLREERSSAHPPLPAREIPRSTYPGLRTLHSSTNTLIPLSAESFSPLWSELHNSDLTSYPSGASSVFRISAWRSFTSLPVARSNR
ncbi:hypothetical protein F511_11202 [Dorcoceras hygrometricum]|uniref:Uncharacterized protein n=1 Tax=Dorcoceras hygrometricum TaxID=472368 RepID=A0A2Z7CZX1_9LAMI|nr:hypothetical protein F511_11202 [Dorcoceras hygrometricum]